MKYNIFIKNSLLVYSWEAFTSLLVKTESNPQIRKMWTNITRGT